MPEKQKSHNVTENCKLMYNYCNHKEKQYDHNFLLFYQSFLLQLLMSESILEFVKTGV